MPLQHAWLPSSYAALSRPCFAPLSRYGAQACAASQVALAPALRQAACLCSRRTVATAINVRR